MPAESAAAASAPQTTETDSPESQPHPSAALDTSALMARLGVPQAMQSELTQETVKEEAPAEPVAPEDEQPTEPEAISDETEVEGETPEAEETPEEETEEDGEPKAEEGLDPELHKARKKEWKQRKRAQRAEAEAAELREKIELLGKTEPVTVQPTVADPLAHVTSPEDLEKERAQFKFLRDMARAKPDGWIANEGTAQEVVISREQAQQYLSYAEDVLSEQFPRKEQELREVRPQARAQAEKIMPEMFKTGSKDQVAANALWRMYPIIASHPHRDMLTAVMLKGYQTLLSEQTAAPASNGNGKGAKLQIPEKILKAHEERGKTPVLKQTPPGRPPVGGQRTNGELDRSMERLNKSGDRKALAAAIGNLPPISGSTNGRKLAPV